MIEFKDGHLKIVGAPQKWWTLEPAIIEEVAQCLVCNELVMK